MSSSAGVKQLRKKCSFLEQAIESIGALLSETSLLGRFPHYPLVLLHADWGAEDKALVHAVVDGRVPLFWNRVTFGEEALPPALYGGAAALEARILAPWRRLHPAGDVTRPA